MTLGTLASPSTSSVVALLEQSPLTHSVTLEELEEYDELDVEAEGAMGMLGMLGMLGKCSCLSVLSLSSNKEAAPSSLKNGSSNGSCTAATPPNESTANASARAVFMPLCLMRLDLQSPC